MRRRSQAACNQGARAASWRTLITKTKNESPQSKQNRKRPKQANRSVCGRQWTGSSLWAPTRRLLLWAPGRGLETQVNGATDEARPASRPQGGGFASERRFSHLPGHLWLSDFLLMCLPFSPQLGALRGLGMSPSSNPRYFHTGSPQTQKQMREHTKHLIVEGGERKALLMERPVSAQGVRSREARSPPLTFSRRGSVSPMFRSQSFWGQRTGAHSYPAPRGSVVAER